MRILLTGATGYIGKRLLLALLEQGHHVFCCVRDKDRFHLPGLFENQVEVLEMDFLNKDSLRRIPNTIDGAYYLMHSMSASANFYNMERTSAVNFREALNDTRVGHVVYLSGIVNDTKLSRHLSSRKMVEDELAKGRYHFSALRAGIIIGSGSASFEIIRDLVEKLPVMVAPKWVQTRCQPIAVRDVIAFLVKGMFNEAIYDQNFDIGGPDVLSYKEMMMGYAHVRGLRRKIGVVPFMTPRLSSYWLYFITSTSYSLAVSLVNSMKVEVVCRDAVINTLLDIRPMGYSEALERTLMKIEENQIVSSWKGALSSGRFNRRLSPFLNVPQRGCFFDRRRCPVVSEERCVEKIWHLGGGNGWYYATWLWALRGFMDRLFGGVGLRRGRVHPTRLLAGDPLDFWRVLYANKEEGRLLLFAEMRLPGEAWLEFKVSDGWLWQTASFRPKGLWGRVYWYLVFPLHQFVFKGLLVKLAK